MKVETSPTTKPVVEEDAKAKKEESTTTIDSQRPTKGKGSKQSKDDGSNKKQKKAVSKADRWNAHFEECKEFAKKHGHCKIPTSYKDNKALGVWVQETRRNYKLMATGGKPRAPLSDEQVEKLNDIEFHWGFTPDPSTTAESETSWEANFAKLKSYKETNGDFDVPMQGTSVNLAKWARAQRHQNNLRATKRKSFMTKERVKQLDSIGFDWDGPRKIDG
jgi:Helicase associated domain